MRHFLSKKTLRVLFPVKSESKLAGFFQDFFQFLRVFKWYAKKRLDITGEYFEIVKNFIVERLVWRRGRLTKPFVHTGLMFILTFAVVFGPVIANKYPTLGKEEREFNIDTPSSVLNTITASAVDTATQESSKPRDKMITYKVVKGDTLSGVAKKFFGTDSEMALNTLRWENNLSSDELSVDQELDILPVPGMKHIVSSGETIYTIAKKYNTNAQKIVDFPFNYFRDEETFSLNIGDLLVVPDGVKPAEKPYIPPTYYAQVQTPVGGGTGELIWPASGEITQYVSWYHSGVDIANSSAPDIIAAASGVVSFVSFETWGYGYHVVVNHGSTQTLYAHLSRTDVSDGQSVSAGQVLGKMGSTGRSTGTHLHFEVRQGGSILDPMAFLK